MGNGNEDTSETNKNSSDENKSQNSKNNTEDSARIKELEAKIEKQQKELSESQIIKELEGKIKEQEKILEHTKTKANQVIKELIKENKSTGKNSDDLFPGVRKTNTFEGAYRNGYENGEVEAFIKKQKELEAKALVQT